MCVVSHVAFFGAIFGRVLDLFLARAGPPRKPCRTTQCLNAPLLKRGIACQKCRGGGILTDAKLQSEVVATTGLMDPQDKGRKPQNVMGRKNVWIFLIRKPITSAVVSDDRLLFPSQRGNLPVKAKPKATKESAFGPSKPNVARVSLFRRQGCIRPLTTSTIQKIRRAGKRS